MIIIKTFEPHELFCAVCFIPDSFFINDDSLFPSECPHCGNVGRCIRYEDLTLEQQKIIGEK